MQTFRIEPEFQNKIPPIREDEFKQLRENILEAGEVYEPLVVWNGILIDGHNRWKVIQEKPSIKYRVREMDFPNEWMAFEWMYKNQLGRRNLTDEQRTYTIGKMYEARKKSLGAPSGNENAKKQMEENLPIVSGPSSTAIVIGKEAGVSHDTVKKAEKFAKGVDLLRQVSQEAADKVLYGKANVTKEYMREIAKMDREEVTEAADAIIAGNKRFHKATGKANGNTAENRELRRIINEAYAPVIDTEAASTYGINDLCTEIEENGRAFSGQLHRIIEHRRPLLENDQDRNSAKNAANHVLHMIAEEVHAI